MLPIIGHRGLKDQPVGGKAMGLEAAARLQRALWVVENGRTQQQAAVGHGSDDAGPALHRLIAELVEVVGAAKGDTAIGEGRQRAYFDRHRRARETEVGVGQPLGLFHPLIFLFLRDDPGVGQHIVDGWHAGRGEIAEPCHRHGGRLAC